MLNNFAGFKWWFTDEGPTDQEIRTGADVWNNNLADGW